MKLDTHALAAEIAPKLVDLLRQNEERIVAQAGGFLQRSALHAVFPILLREIPILSEVMVTLVSQRFGSMTFDDVAASFLAIKQTARYDMGNPGTTGTESSPVASVDPIP
jgi:hypothetical protein